MKTIKNISKMAILILFASSTAIQATFFCDVYGLRTTINPANAKASDIVKIGRYEKEYVNVGVNRCTIKDLEPNGLCTAKELQHPLTEQCKQIANINREAKRRKLEPIHSCWTGSPISHCPDRQKLIEELLGTVAEIAQEALTSDEAAEVAVSKKIKEIALRNKDSILKEYEREMTSDSQADVIGVIKNAGNGKGLSKYYELLR